MLALDTGLDGSDLSAEEVERLENIGCWGVVRGLSNSCGVRERACVYLASISRLEFVSQISIVERVYITVDVLVYLASTLLSNPHQPKEIRKKVGLWPPSGGLRCHVDGPQKELAANSSSTQTTQDNMKFSLLSVVAAAAAVSSSSHVSLGREEEERSGGGGGGRGGGSARQRDIDPCA